MLEKNNDHVEEFDYLTWWSQQSEPQDSPLCKQCRGQYKLRVFPDRTEEEILKTITGKDGSDQQTLDDMNQFGDLTTGNSYEPQNGSERDDMVVIRQVEKKIKKPLKLYPGETKNLAKNLIRAKQLFICKIHQSQIEQIFSAQEIRANKTLKAFLNLPPKLASKFKLDEFLETRIGWEIGRHFFGQYMWSSIFVQENKTELEQYIRLNSLWIKPRPTTA